MCGIIGFSGQGALRDIIGRGLEDLEYRGYDSCGFAFASADGLVTEKQAESGMIKRLVERLPERADTPCLVIAHTRWATHGKISVENTHPQLDCSGTLAIVHNGIIENHRRLREALEKSGHRFVSETDTEAAAHLVEAELANAEFAPALFAAFSKLGGEFALGLIGGKPPRLALARQGSPLLIAAQDGNLFFASDPRPLLRHADHVAALGNGEAAIAADGRFRRFNFRSGREITGRPRPIRLGTAPGENNAAGGFMLREIAEQPAALNRTAEWFAADFAPRFLKKPCRPERIAIFGCGTSWHAALLGKYLIEELAGIPTEVEYASEFRYRVAAPGKNRLFVAISQSGETADTLGAARKIHGKAPLLAICNTEGSSLAGLSDYALFNRAGPEIGVASTKAFTSQVAALYLFANLLGNLSGRLPEGAWRRAQAMISGLAAQLRAFLDRDDGSVECAGEIARRASALFLGRGLQYPIALEGALKLKEVSYIHAEGYPAAEMKHGPLALVDGDMPVIFIVTAGHLYRKTLGNMEEVRARGGVIFTVTDCDNREIRRLSKHVLPVPSPADKRLAPMLTVVPLQLLACRIAQLRGVDADRPRNLAKSVTVE